MAQHDNGRRPTGTPTGAWQQGQREHPQDFSSAQQDQSSAGRYGSPAGGGQLGGHAEPGSRGHQNQYDDIRQQQGDNWRERQGPAAGGWRPALEERDRSWNDRGGQGSFGGQAADNDYGNRGVTESGNFGNYGGGRADSYGTMSGQARYGQGGTYDQGGQSAQRFGGYRQGYDARSDSTGGYGSSDFGPEYNRGSGRYGGGDWNQGSYGERPWQRHDQGGYGRDQGRDYYSQGFRRDYERGQGQAWGQTWGQPAADDFQGGRGWQGPSNLDRYGDNGYQGNWIQGQRGQAYHDPDYRQWRQEQMSRLDREYEEWRQHRYQRFSEDFDKWRAERDSQRNAGQGGGGIGTSEQGHGAAAGGASGMQSGTSRHDISSTGDKGAGKTATK